MTFADIAPSLLGGILIGLAASLMLLGAGRIAGISGIFGNVLTRSPDPVRLAFFVGLIAAPWLVRLFAPLPLGQTLEQPHWPLLALSGVLVGAGTYIGSGCTSGHGVCGLANLSPRGLVATLVFMATAMLVVGLGFGAIR